MEATRTRKKHAKLTDTHHAIREACRRQFEAEGRITTVHIGDVCGLTPLEVTTRIRAPRYHGQFPWKVTRVVAYRYYGGGHGRENVDDASWRENIPAVWATAVRGMIDARSEVDDPREHGILAQPRSLPRPPQEKPDPATQTRMWLEEDRAIRQRWGIGRDRRVA